ncbi:MAG: TIGR02688 family protein, partial [Planctomycetes bacterium RBG_16_64_12]
ATVFAGKVVRKDLVRKVKVGANVPVFVLEYLLGKYCATDDPAAIEAGLKVVNTTLSSNFVRSDEANKAQSMVKDKGKHTLIDKVKVRYLADDDKYWAELVNFGHKYVHVPEHYLRQYDRLLMEGIWAQVDIRHQYDEEAKGKKSPFWIDGLKPIQVASFDLGEYCQGRAQFTTDEWIDLLVRSVGLEPAYFSRRVKLIMLMRLLPLCEHNFNLVELGPRSTGKSYAYQELSPYTILLTGPTTVANLFFNMATGKMGLVGIWDAIGFDEVADLQKMPKEVVTTLKTYCESGTFARGKESMSGMASLAMFGNTNQPVDVMVRSSHLFMPMPDVIREDMAFLDRIHYYIPGWEIPKMRVEFFTDHYGFVVDYLAEALRELRRYNYTEVIDRHFSLGSHLNARDVKATRKTVSGLVKLLYPLGEFSREELAEILAMALEGRRRVKEQLKKMGSFEYHQTSFSYIDSNTRDERFVGVPEQGGRDMISTDPLAPGSLYTASVDDQAKVGLYRLEVGCSPGTGKLKIAGGVDGSMKESIQRAYAYLMGQKGKMGIAQQVDTTDFHVEAIDLLSNHVPCEAGIALVVAVYSAVKKTSVLAGLVILGDLSIQGNIKRVRSLAEPLQVAMDNGARRALVPLENKRNFLEVSGDIVERVDPIFFSDPMTAAMKALGMT